MTYKISSPNDLYCVESHMCFIELEAYLRQFLRTFIYLTSYRDPSSKVGFGWGIFR